MIPEWWSQGLCKRGGRLNRYDTILAPQRRPQTLCGHTRASIGTNARDSVRSTRRRGETQREGLAGIGTNLWRPRPTETCRRRAGPHARRGTKAGSDGIGPGQRGSRRGLRRDRCPGEKKENRVSERKERTVSIVCLSVEPGRTLLTGITNSPTAPAPAPLSAVSWCCGVPLMPFGSK